MDYNITRETTIHRLYTPGAFTDAPNLADSYSSTSSASMNWSALSLSTVIAASVLGNVLVCLAVCWEKRLQNMTNYFLMSLAIADLFVSILVMPLAMVVELYGYFPLPEPYCVMWTTMDVMLCTSSIWHMCTMSMDRYFTLKYPMKYGRNKTKGAVLLKITFVWITSVSISCPLLIYGFVDYNNVFSVKDRTCVPSLRNFVIYGSLFAFYIPLGTMVVTYCLTVRILRGSNEKKKINNTKSMKRKSFYGTYGSRNDTMMNSKTSEYSKSAIANSVHRHNGKASLASPVNQNNGQYKDTPLLTQQTPIPSAYFSNVPSSPTASSVEDNMSSNITMKLCEIEREMDTCLTSDESTPSTVVNGNGHSITLQGRRLSQPCPGRYATGSHEYQITRAPDLNQRHSCPVRAKVSPDHTTYLFIGADMDSASTTTSNSTGHAPQVTKESSSSPLETCLLIRALSARFGVGRRGDICRERGGQYSEGVSSDGGGVSTDKVGVARQGEDTCDSSATSITSRGSTPMPCPSPRHCNSPGRGSSPEPSLTRVTTPTCRQREATPTSRQRETTPTCRQREVTTTPPTFRQSPTPYRNTRSNEADNDCHRLSPNLALVNRPYTNGASSVKKLSKCNLKPPEERRPLKHTRCDATRRRGALTMNRSEAASISMSKRTASNERKASKVLGIIVGVFLVLWTPFFAFNVLTVVCERCSRSIPRSAVSAVIWLGYASSLANPIIYTMFNTSFRQAFYHILTGYYACSAKARRKQRRGRAARGSAYATALAQTSIAAVGGSHASYGRRYSDNPVSRRSETSWDNSR